MIWIRSANSHTGARQMIGRIGRRSQHPTTRDTKLEDFSCARGGAPKVPERAVLADPAAGTVALDARSWGVEGFDASVHRSRRSAATDAAASEQAGGYVSEENPLRGDPGLHRRARSAGAKLTKVRRRSNHADHFDFYRHLTACFTYPLKPRCTANKVKRAKRWKYEDVLA